MGDDKRRRSPSRSPPPRGGRDSYDDGRSGGRSGGGRYDSREHDRGRDRDYDRDRATERDRERDRERDTGRGRSRSGALEDAEPYGGGGRGEARREDRYDGGRGGAGGGQKRELPSDRGASGGDYRSGGGSGSRDAKRERVDGGDWERQGGDGGGRGGGGGGGGRDRESSKYMSREEREAKEREAEEAAKPKAPKEQPNLGLSGKLAAETNKTTTGVELKHVPPAEARKPDKRWRLYIFKNDQLQDEPYRIHRMDHYLFGRDVSVADIVTAHPSCSKQHAVLQFRLTDKDDPATGLADRSVRPYLLDLGSVNGTFLNGERLEGLRYYELLEKDVIRFGQSTREYVLLHDESGGAD